jgi:hypothetical protein
MLPLCCHLEDAAFRNYGTEVECQIDPGTLWFRQGASVDGQLSP